MTADADVTRIASRDGTVLAVERRGEGRPLLLVHGTSSKRGRWAGILERLGEGRQLHWMDRRGRGASGDGPDHRIEREFEDVAAVVDAIGGQVDVFGHSYGAICALMATALTDRIGRLILYEPPIGVVSSPEAAEEIDRHVGRGDLSGGLACFLGTVLKVPAERVALMRAQPDWSPRLDVVPTIARELRAVEAFHVSPGRLAAIANRTLLVSGADSPAGFVAAVELLASALPNTVRAILPGQQHQAIDTAPDLLLGAVLPFLATRA